MRGVQGYSAYSQNDISIESSEKLILMLYEGALKFASQAKIAMEKGDIEKKIYWTNRTSSIFFELINSIEYSAGNVAYYLEGIYNQEIKLLNLACIENDTDKLNEVMNVTRELIDAWKENVMKVEK